jgi:hypothetical protein
MSWIDEIKASDIASDGLRLIAETCGISDAIILGTKMAGIDLYIPAQGMKLIKFKYVKDHYNGNNLSSLSVSVDLPRSKIEELIKNGIPDINKDEILCNKIMKIVSQRCGYMVAERLIVNFPGERILIPKNSFMDFKKKYIEKNFNGTNIIELALLLEVSEIFVRKTIAEMYYKKQMVSLFDA